MAFTKQETTVQSQFRCEGCGGAIVVRTRVVLTDFAPGPGDMVRVPAKKVVHLSGEIVGLKIEHDCLGEPEAGRP